MKLIRAVKIWLSGLITGAIYLLLLSGVGMSRLADPVHAGSVRSQGRELHETYNIAANGVVAVSNTSGYIRVTSWNENRVKLDAVKRGPREDELDQVEIQVVTRPDRIEVRTIYPRGRSSRVSVDYDLRVPRTASLNGLTNISGEITVSDPVASVNARTTSGNITVRQVTGDAILSSTSGRIAADRIGGSLSVITTSGDLAIGEVASTLNARCTSCNIRATGLRDDVIAQSTSGNIEIERIGGRVTARATSGWVRVNDVGGDVNAESFSDSVTVTNVRGHVAAKALSGNVVVRNAGEGARISAVSGNIEVSDARGRIEIGATSGTIVLRNIDSRDVSAKCVSGGVNFTGKVYEDGRYEFVSFSGNLVLVLPPDSNFNLTAQSHSGSINTEFPLQIRQGSQFGGRGPITGTVGKGGAELRAISHSGNVQIRKDTGQKR
jgi:DUF4097 and DUF4098 domain-containing protein YvlB